LSFFADPFRGAHAVSMWGGGAGGGDFPRLGFGGGQQKGGFFFLPGGFRGKGGGEFFPHLGPGGCRGPWGEKTQKNAPFWARGAGVSGFFFYKPTKKKLRGGMFFSISLHPMFLKIFFFFLFTLIRFFCPKFIFGLYPKKGGGGKGGGGDFFFPNRWGKGDGGGAYLGNSPGGGGGDSSFAYVLLSFFFVFSRHCPAGDFFFLEGPGGENGCKLCVAVLGRKWGSNVQFLKKGAFVAGAQQKQKKKVFVFSSGGGRGLCRAGRKFPRWGGGGCNPRGGGQGKIFHWGGGAGGGPRFSFLGGGPGRASFGGPGPQGARSLCLFPGGGGGGLVVFLGGGFPFWAPPPKEGFFKKKKRTPWGGRLFFWGGLGGDVFNLD